MADVLRERSRNDKCGVHTPPTYAKAVEDYARVTHEDSLYPGQDFEALNRFLRSPLHQHTSATTSSHNDTKSRITPTAPIPVLSDVFASHYSLEPGEHAEARHISAPEELEFIAEKASTQKSKQFLILRGYPSPAWLCAIGACYDVDPSFFRRHLSFLDKSIHSGVDSGHMNDGVSSLPSSCDNIFQFSLPTVGSYTGPRSNPRGHGEDLTRMRDRAASDMNAYNHRLRIGKDWSVGDSILRQYNLLDQKDFAIEQAVTVYFARLRAVPEQWVVIVYLDSGKDLTNSDWPGPQAAKRIHPYPHQKQFMALKHDLWKDVYLGTNSSGNLRASQPRNPYFNPNSPLAQTGSRLHIRYGRLLRPEMMCQDPLYALSELFTVFACAEAQLLDILESGISNNSRLAVQGDDGSEDNAKFQQVHRAQNNLIHSREMLESRIENIYSVLEFITRRRTTELWPRAAESRDRRENDNAVRLLQLDFEHLHRRATTLYSRSESAMTLAMNRASIAEARRGIMQSRILSRFTALAFVFVPVSTVASIFSMDLTELGNGVSVWVFFAVTVPIGCLCFMFLFNGWRKSWALGKRGYDWSMVKLRNRLDDGKFSNTE